MHNRALDPAQKPRLKSSSDVAWGMWHRHTTEQSRKNVRIFMCKDVVNDQTEEIVDRALSVMGKWHSGWPGTDLEPSFEEGREAETEAALALLGWWLPLLFLTMLLYIVD